MPPLPRPGKVSVPGPRLTAKPRGAAPVMRRRVGLMPQRMSQIALSKALAPKLPMRMQPTQPSAATFTGPNPATLGPMPPRF